MANCGDECNQIPFRAVVLRDVERTAGEGSNQLVDELLLACVSLANHRSVVPLLITCQRYASQFQYGEAFKV